MVSKILLLYFLYLATMLVAESRSLDTWSCFDLIYTIPCWWQNQEVRIRGAVSNGDMRMKLYRVVSLAGRYSAVRGQPVKSY